MGKRYGIVDISEGQVLDDNLFMTVNISKDIKPMVFYYSKDAATKIKRDTYEEGIEKIFSEIVGANARNDFTNNSDEICDSRFVQDILIISLGFQLHKMITSIDYSYEKKAILIRQYLDILIDRYGYGEEAPIWWDDTIEEFEHKLKELEINLNYFFAIYNIKQENINIGTTMYTILKSMQALYTE